MAEEKKAAIRTTKKPEAADKNAVKKEETAADDLAAKKTKSPAKKTVKKATATTKNKATTKKTVRKTAEAPVEKPVLAAAAADDAAGKTIPAVKADTADTAASQPAVAAAPAGTEKKTVEKKPAAKKTTAKKAATKKAEEPAKEEKKAPAKKTAAKKTVVKEQDEKAEKAKEAAVDAPSLNEVTIEEVKAVTAPVEEPKKPAEEPAKEEKKEPKASAEEKAAAYNAFNLDTIMEMANELGIEKTYDDYKKMLIANNDPEQIAKDLAQEATKAESFTFEEDGYDVDLIPVLVAKVSDTIDWDAANLLPLGDRIQEACAMELGEDALANTNVYNTLFDTVREVLMIAQQENVHDLAQINEMTGADVKALVVKFMDVAYDILKSWQYNDVKYYEGFIYSVLSQFEELHQQLGTRAMMDVADLLILHGDFGLGDANYHYIIRENNIKDMIYFRFANVYRGIDRDKARAIAHEALQWVDGRYDYYQAILDILHN